MCCCSCSGGFCGMCYSIPSAVTAAACVCVFFILPILRACMRPFLPPRQHTSQQQHWSLQSDPSNLSKCGFGSVYCPAAATVMCVAVKVHKGCSSPSWLLQCTDAPVRLVCSTLCSRTVRVHPYHPRPPLFCHQCCCLVCMGRCGVMLITVGFEMPFLNADTRHCLGTA